MLEHGGRNMLYVTLCNHEHGSLETSRAMMRHPAAVLGLGDGGAHSAAPSATAFRLLCWPAGARPHRGEQLSLWPSVRAAGIRHVLWDCPIVA